ncbi:aldehyde oxidase and xanthine dehydrogenase molybdopterin binding protein [Halogeometricum pallidum JCM 14848]|uniref:Aldehyde oxidase and xanthine dehydrogenase molybdopterin binding protein n=1 Tax=Halogeometricum pallidum JCM 14848 TaxID=1227487 RepID=M0DK74_HALPD|nr:xanthine dehydrogenase family protein molybdopterin-binding subunit [Halogeometricum pallidum]ELZ35102.1 aldehyde oxidase and xanthine dehydrogenase molybdopterin binding protein [Halogeometricum pallidum JCM 14848]
MSDARDGRADDARTVGGEESDGSTSGDRLVGRGIDRREDAELLTGRATYTDDISSDAAHLAFVRSSVGHGRIESIDASEAEEMGGVLGVYAWADLDASPSPGVLPIRTESLDCEVPGHPVLARERVRYEGQPVAAVVAEDRYVARDAVEAVDVEYESLPAVVDPAEATADGAPTLYETAPDNVALDAELGDAAATEEAFSAADRVVELELVNNRLIASALEPRAALARYDADTERFTVEMTSQSPHGHRGKLAETLGVSESRVRVIVPRVGGGFGHKGHHHPGEAMAAWCARELGRPVKWTATRSENYREGAHARDHRTSAELAVDDDGTVRGLRVDTRAAVGGYGLGGGASMPGWYGRLLSSQYRIPAIHCRTRAVFTNTAPVHSYRGAGRPEAIYVTERLMDAAADELGVDPVGLRRRNLIAPEEFPYETAVGASYDSGDYETALDEVLDAIGYDELRERAGEPGDDGRYRGVSVACFTESTGGGFERGVVRVRRDGSVAVYAGTHSHGQGHETTYAQLVADELGVPYDDVEVVEGDTDDTPDGTGTFGSRSTVTGGSAVVESARDVLRAARGVAADRLGVDAADVVSEAGEFRVVGRPERSVSFADAARAAETTDDGASEKGEGDGVAFEASTRYEPDGTAYAFGTHAALVAVDGETGAVEIERYVAVDDCGERVNPTIVEGQVHGGVAQGIGQARSEGAAYDDDGRLLTDSMLSYALPRATSLPDIETRATVTPSPRNPIGAKGIGEAGTIAAPPTVVNAVVDALSPFGIEHVDMPLTEENVLDAIRTAEDEV